jgi:hypothetical protein
MTERISHADGALDYLFAYPTSIPDGKLLVHNRVTVGITPKRRPGVSGFRIWLDDADAARREPCDCGWAPELGVHYRVRRGS